ncbi:MAG: family 16 glycosylhydrolase [Eubacterium sp.]|nr:family 16 glycosylhydrolase [Eubacterium sp.]
MKKFRKGISILVALAMLVTICAVDSPKVSQAGVKVVVGKKLKVEISDTDTIVVKGKAKAKSSNSKIAKVDKITKFGKNSNVHIKGLKVGKTTVKVKVGKKSKKIKVTVYPKTVSGVRAQKNSETAATISWKKSKGASGYRIYRSNSENGGFKKIASKKGAKKTSFYNSGLQKGRFYYYKIQAYGKKGIKSEDLSSAVSVRTWKQIWSDEFNGNKVDDSKWQYDTGGGGWGNRELQIYRPENNIVKDGKLLIKTEFLYDPDAEKCVDKIVEKYIDEHGKEQKKEYDTYFSGRMNTKGKFYFKYGRLEFRAKQAKGVGTWTAGWALGKDKVWPNCGEIDVFETTSAKAKTTIPQSLHCKKFNGMAGSSANKHFDSTVPTATSQYHTYGVIWTDHDITFTIDGAATGNYNPDTFAVSGKGVDDLTVWPYCQPFYLIVNCAIGGVLGGVVTPEYWEKEGGLDKYGYQKYVDYLYYDWIRVYQ